MTNEPMTSDPAATAADTDDQAPFADPRQQAMQDEDIVERLQADPEDMDAKLDAGSDQSMDGSDPIAVVQPGDTGEPVPSSGFDEAQESQLRAS